MKFTKIPQNYTPVTAGLVFGIDTESEQPRDIAVEIRDTITGCILGRQRLYGVIEAEIDVAPYLRQVAVRAPVVPETGGSAFFEAPAITFAVEAEGAVSPEVTVSGNLVEMVLPAAVTAMPEHRRIAHGEHDEVLLLGRSSLYRAYITSDAGDERMVEYEPLSGAAIFRFDTAELSPAARRAEAAIFAGRTQVVTLCYSVGQRMGADMRLAWLSPAGSIERYTFPAVRSVERNVVRKRVARADGSALTVECCTDECIRLVSDYVDRATAAALASIPSSPAVWAEYGDICSAVEVLSSSSTLYALGRPDSVEIDLRLRRREVAL